MNPLILLIEDDPAIRNFLRVSLSANDYRLTECATAKEGLMQAAASPPDVILLDLGLPDIDGIELTRQIRSWSKVPILIISARGKEQDKITALDAGADDYLTKPFGIGELLARLRVALRHLNTSDKGDATFTTGDLHVDLAMRIVTIAGNQVHLTPNEYRLLALLVKHAGKVLTHKQILHDIWGPDSATEVHYLRVYMNQLRQKIEPDPAQPRHLITEPGVGYRLVEE